MGILTHGCGTCLGQSITLLGQLRWGKVIDSKLRVHGVQGLRVVDASIFPSPVAATTQATGYAIAEAAALHGALRNFRDHPCSPLAVVLQHSARAGKAKIDGKASRERKLMALVRSETLKCLRLMPNDLHNKGLLPI